jgi:hypothetical protein
MAIVHDDERTPLVRRPPEPVAHGSESKPSFADSLIVLVFLGVLGLIGMGLFGLMPR